MIPVSVHDWTPDTDPVYTLVLAACSRAGIDLDRISMAPDGVFTLTTDNGYVAFGEDDQSGDECGGDWWTAVAYSGHGNEPTPAYEGDSLPDLVAALAALK